MGNIKKHQVVILGGGMVGLTLAKGLIDQGINVAVIERNQPKLDFSDNKKDLRVSAINRFSEQLLDKLGVWQAIYEHDIAPFNQMYVFDQGSSGQIKMDALEIAERELGFIIENRVIVKTLWQGLVSKNAALYAPYTVESLIRNNHLWQLQLSDGSLIESELLVGADGAGSWLRNQFDFALKKRPYKQHALVAEIEIEKSHKSCATQRFLSTGPLAFLPLTDPFRCSIVWSTSENEATRLIELDEASFNEQLSNAFNYHYGQCSVQSQRVKFPLVEQHVDQYVKDGVVLIGDAAHVIHPLAGQGVNLGFRDASSLIDVLAAAHRKGRSLSELSTLKQYERERRWHNQLLIWMMTAFKTGFTNESKILGFLRGKGLSFVDRQALLKRFFMTQAMGKKGLM
ncbi:UbiH/UbiF/VisC/COQ6 family ubiquinone biosynthesis hydroxylase [Thiotrichales bacterium 19S3-7]|nr:UbiH/UbiF/VisC/COQ6 family ubiquinone biosynthesis hydroxylase [Thiotrichales bacterium 19S3-7]MCF6800742.1 UbiH/UbiF/VisC/COQ6 family ubiquinone biosynthesis hydroxylase [Thiotrichales bacterium 19S3-11]